MEESRRKLENTRKQRRSILALTPFSSKPLARPITNPSADPAAKLT
jgi:hypothetical protein